MSEFLSVILLVNAVVAFVFFKMGSKIAASKIDAAAVIKLTKDTQRALASLEGFGENQVAILDKISTINKNITITAKNNKVYNENCKLAFHSIMDGQNFQNYYLTELLEMIFPETVATAHIMKAVDDSMFNVVYSDEGVERTSKAAKEFAQSIYDKAYKHAGYDTKEQYNIKNLINS